jgi:hypothetical protein
MTHHDGSTSDHARDDAVPTSAEAADFVHPVDHGEGTKEEPLASEDEGSYVSGAVHEHVSSADTVPMTMDEKGDYVTPVDHGAGTEIDADEEAGEYVDAEHNDDNQHDTK